MIGGARVLDSMTKRSARMSSTYIEWSPLRRKGVTPSQLALAWVLAQGDDILPIPGTKRRKYLEQNVAAVEIRLSSEELEELDKAVPRGAIQGDRYAKEMMRYIHG